jgi:hypothetical protein
VPDSAWAKVLKTRKFPLLGLCSTTKSLPATDYLIGASPPPLGQHGGHWKRGLPDSRPRTGRLRFGSRHSKDCYSLAWSRSCGGPEDRSSQGHWLSDAPENVGARRSGARSPPPVKFQPGVSVGGITSIRCSGLTIRRRFVLPAMLSDRIATAASRQPDCKFALTSAGNDHRDRIYRQQ